jgi:hypothetical integral membrane protein (TIGR02206 family)
MGALTGGFQTFGSPHLIVMALTLVLPVLLSLIAKRAGSRVATAVGFVLAGVLLGNELIHWGFRISGYGPGVFLRYFLPLHLCGVAIFLTSLTLLFRNQEFYEVAYFWGLVGSANAVVTPGNLDVDYPQYRFFQYFFSHSGIVAGVLYATWGLKMRPTLGGLFRAFVWLHVLAAIVAVVNLLCGSNYMYLSSPPWGTVSPFFFLPWPWYLVFLDLFGLAMFFLVYSPFPIARWWNSRRMS